MRFDDALRKNPNLIIRMVALILVPCLAGEPAQAFVGAGFHPRPLQVFVSQALTHPPSFSGLTEEGAQWRGPQKITSFMRAGRKPTNILALFGGTAGIFGLGGLLLRLRTRTPRMSRTLTLITEPRAPLEVAQSWRHDLNLRLPGKHMGNILYGAASLSLWYLEEWVFRDLAYTQLGDIRTAHRISVYLFAALHPILERLWIRWLRTRGDIRVLSPEPLGMIILRIAAAQLIDHGWGHHFFGLPSHYIFHFGWNAFALSWNHWTPEGWIPMPVMSFLQSRRGDQTLSDALESWKRQALQALPSSLHAIIKSMTMFGNNVLNRFPTARMSRWTYEFREAARDIAPQGIRIELGYRWTASWREILQSFLHVYFLLRHPLTRNDEFMPGWFVWRTFGLTGMYASMNWASGYGRNIPESVLMALVANGLTHGLYNTIILPFEILFEGVARIAHLEGWMMLHHASLALQPASLMIRNPQGPFQEGRAWANRNETLAYWKEKARVAFGGTIPGTLQSLEASDFREDQFVRTVMGIARVIERTRHSGEAMDALFKANGISPEEFERRQDLILQLRRLDAELWAENLKFIITNEKVLRTEKGGMSATQERLFDWASRLRRSASVSGTLDRISPVEVELLGLARRITQIKKWLDRLDQIEGTGFLKEYNQSRKMRDALLNLSQDQLGLGWSDQQDVVNIGMAKIEKVVRNRNRGALALIANGPRLDRAARRIVELYPVRGHPARLGLESQLQHLRFRIGNGAPQHNIWTGGWETPLLQLEHQIALRTPVPPLVSEMQPTEAVLIPDVEEVPVTDTTEIAQTIALIEHVAAFGFRAAENAFDEKVFDWIDGVSYRAIPEGLAKAENNLMQGEDVVTLWTEMNQWSRLTPENQEALLESVSLSMPPETVSQFRDFAWHWRRNVEKARETVRWWTVLMYLEAVVDGLGKSQEDQDVYQDVAHANIESVGHQLKQLGIPPLGEADIYEESLNEAKNIQESVGTRRLQVWDLSPETAPRSYATLARALRYGGPIFLSTFDEAIWTPLKNVQDVAKATALFQRLKDQDLEGGWPLYKWLTDLAQGLERVQGDNNLLYDNLVHEFHESNGLAFKDLENLKTNTWALGTQWQAAQLTLITVIHDWTEEQTHTPGQYAALRDLALLVPSAKVRADIEEAPLQYMKTQMDRLVPGSLFQAMSRIEKDAEAGLDAIQAPEEIRLGCRDRAQSAYQSAAANLLNKSREEPGGRSWIPLCKEVKVVHSPLLRAALSAEFEKRGAGLLTAGRGNLAELAKARKYILEVEGRLKDLAESSPDLTEPVVRLQTLEDQEIRAAIDGLFHHEHPDLAVLSAHPHLRSWYPLIRSEYEAWLDNRIRVCGTNVGELKGLEVEAHRMSEVLIALPRGAAFFQATVNPSRIRLEKTIAIAARPRRRTIDPAEMEAVDKILSVMVSLLDTVQSHSFALDFVLIISQMAAEDLASISEHIKPQFRVPPAEIFIRVEALRHEVFKSLGKITRRPQVQQFQKRIEALAYYVGAFVNGWETDALRNPRTFTRDLNSGILYYSIWIRIVMEIKGTMAAHSLQEKTTSTEESSYVTTSEPGPELDRNLVMLEQLISELADSFGDAKTALGASLGQAYRVAMARVQNFRQQYLDRQRSGDQSRLRLDIYELSSLVIVENVFHWFCSVKPNNKRLQGNIATALVAILRDFGEKITQTRAESLLGADKRPENFLSIITPGIHRLSSNRSPPSSPPMAEGSKTLLGKAVNEALLHLDSRLNDRLDAALSQRLYDEFQNELSRLRDHPLGMQWSEAGRTSDGTGLSHRPIPAHKNLADLTAIIHGVDQANEEQARMTPGLFLAFFNAIVILTDWSDTEAYDRANDHLPGESEGMITNLAGAYFTIVKQAQIQLSQAGVAEGLLSEPYLIGIPRTHIRTRQPGDRSQTDWSPLFHQLDEDLRHAHQELVNQAPGVSDTLGALQLEVIEGLRSAAMTFKAEDVVDPYSEWTRLQYRLGILFEYQKAFPWYPGPHGVIPDQDNQIDMVFQDIKAIHEAAGDPIDIEDLRPQYGLDIETGSETRVEGIFEKRLEAGT